MSSSVSLAIAGGCSALAALAHMTCIVIGPPAYRFMGAGEAMARAAEAGRWQPVLLTLMISALLAVSAAFAFSAAGLIRPIPFTKLAVTVITAVYIGRALGFPLLRPAFPENSTTFWVISSSICLVIGLLHAHGMWVRWTSI
jgi:hypothetical protein